MATEIVESEIARSRGLIAKALQGGSVLQFENFNDFFTSLKTTNRRIEDYKDALRIAYYEMRLEAQEARIRSIEKASKALLQSDACKLTHESQSALESALSKPWEHLKTLPKEQVPKKNKGSKSGAILGTDEALATVKNNPKHILLKYKVSQYQLDNPGTPCKVFDVVVAADPDADRILAKADAEAFCYNHIEKDDTDLFSANNNPVEVEQSSLSTT